MSKQKDHSARWAEVSDNWEEDLSDDTLRDIAGDDVFERGEAYFEAGKVSMPRDGGGNATFKVKGTKTYSTELYFEDVGLHSYCTCPHAEGGAFCKHMVAAALFWRNKLEGNEPPSQQNTAQDDVKSTASQKRQAKVVSKKEALKAFVFAQDAGVLADQLWSWAQSDRDLMAVLKSWHAQSVAIDEPDGWKTAIAAILEQSRDMYGWGQSSAYARRAEAVFPLLKKITQASPSQGRAACAYALRKLYRVGEDADDSDGMIGDLMEGVQDILLDALQAEPPPAAWLDEWFALMEADPWGLWSESAVLDAAGPAVQKRYSERVAKDWAAYLKTLATTPAVAQKRTVYAASFSGTASAWDPVRSKLRARYINDLKRQDDSVAVLDVLSSNPASANEHSELIAYCESLGKMREALDYALKARKLYPSDWRCEEDLLRCYERGGWDAEALAIRRARLEKQPSVDNYAAVLKAAKAAGQDLATYRETLYQWLAELEVQTEKPKAPWFRPLPKDQGRNVTTRVQWLLFEKDIDAAVALVQAPHTCDAQLLYDISKKIQVKQPDQALVLLHRVFVHLMPRASTPYTEELRLVKEIAPLMPQPGRGQWTARLRADYKLKRNFIKGLDALKL
jgi:SWIM zinc finger